MKGEEMQRLLDSAKKSLEENALVPAATYLRLFRDEIPEGNAAEFTRERLQKLDKWYFPRKKQLDDIIHSGKYLEIPDAMQEKQRLTARFYWEQYYIFQRVYNQFKLYESDSFVDYEI